MKKTCLFVLLLSCFLTATVHAKDVYYEKFRDAKTGRQIEYFDLYEDTTRPYFTQNMWFSDNFGLDPDEYKTGQKIIVYAQVISWSNNTWDGYNSVTIIPKYIEMEK